MANSCYFSMRVTGSKDACQKFYEVLNFQKERCFYGLYETEMTFHGAVPDGYIMEFNGECAWSVLSAMHREQGESYTTLERESKLLNLMIEVYSTETGYQFAEHLLYEDGVCVENESVNYSEIYWDKSDCPTINDLNTRYGTSYSEEDFDMDGYHIEGGFGEWSFATRRVVRI